MKLPTLPRKRSAGDALAIAPKKTSDIAVKPIVIASLIMVAGIAIGIFMALRALSNTGTRPAPGNENWTQGFVDPRDTYAIYAQGHFRYNGLLSPPHSTLYFTRLSDDEGARLRSDCTYELSGPVPPARWWSVSTQAPGRFNNSTAITAGDVVLAGDNTFSLALSRKPRPGNWLAPPSSIYAMQVTLVMNETYDPARNNKLILPKLKRLECP